VEGDQQRQASGQEEGARSERCPERQHQGGGQHGKSEKEQAPSPGRVEVAPEAGPVEAEPGGDEKGDRERGNQHRACQQEPAGTGRHAAEDDMEHKRDSDQGRHHEHREQQWPPREDARPRIHCP